LGEFTQHPLQMGIINDEKMIETYLSYGSNPSFGVRNCIVSSESGEENVEAFVGEDGIECIRVIAIIVADQESQRGWGIIEAPQDLFCLSCDPGLGGVGGDASQVDATSSNLDEEEHIQGFQLDRFHCKAITSQKLVFVMSEEGPPFDKTVANLRQLDVVSFEDIPNSNWGSSTAKLTKLSLDLAITPTKILHGQLGI
jgi:hypothetical protein